MGEATMIEWSFETKYSAPSEIIVRLEDCVRELGLRLRWHGASANGMRWNPLEGRYKYCWDTIAAVLPSATSETERAFDPERTIDFTKDEHA